MMKQVSSIAILLAALALAPNVIAESNTSTVCEVETKAGVPMPAHAIPFVSNDQQTPIWIDGDSGGRVLVEVWVPSGHLGTGTLYSIWICTLLDCLSDGDPIHCSADQLAPFFGTALEAICSLEEGSCPFPQSGQDSAADGSKPDGESEASPQSEARGNATEPAEGP